MTDIRFTTGDARSIVVTKPKDLELIGSIPAYTSVRFVKAAEDYTLESLAEQCKNATSTYEVMDGIVRSVTFENGTDRMFMCYRLPVSILYRRLEESDEGSWSVLNVPFMVKSLDSVTPQLLVAQASTTVTVTGIGISDAKIALSEGDCGLLEESVFKPLEVNSVDLIPSITETGEQNVCVEFPNEPAYGLKTVDIAYIKPMNISLMVDTPLRVELQGFHISAGDQLRIYRNGVCDEENTWTV